MHYLLTFAAMLPSAMAVHYGCYKEISGGHAINEDFLPDFATPPATGMTIEACETHCTVDLDWDLWGLQNSGECRCGNSSIPLPAGSFPMFESDCQMTCAGDPLEKCGGWGYYDLYGLSTTPPALTPAIDPPLTTLTDLGCYTEGSTGRALTGAFHWSSTLTIEGCASFCQSSGFTVAGAEYGSECYCGDLPLATGSVLATGDCTMDCSGDATQKCGAGNRLSIYQWS